MHIEKLNLIKETLACAAEAQMQNLETVDAKELGEVIDIIKDIEETIYYCTVTKAMEESAYKPYTPEENGRSYFIDKVRHQPPYRDDWNDSYLNYYEEEKTGAHSTNHTSNNSYTEKEYPHAFEDARDGKSYRSRRMYMEAKETHQDKSTQMRELEKYMQELTQDVIEMVEDASPEERQYLSKKVSILATKLSQMNG